MEVFIPDTNMSAIMPQIILTIGACLVLLLSVFVHSTRKYLGYLSALTCVAALVNTFMIWDINQTVFAGMITINSYSNAFNMIILISATLIALVTHDAVDDHKIGEFFSIVLISTLGMMIMASSQNLLVIFLGLEILSIGLYVLIGMNRARVHSLEAALKYFLLGAFASGFFLYGISLTYGTTGSFDLVKISRYLQTNNMLGDPLMLSALAMLLIGFGFKVALVPFHMWSPDVYQGAPAPITGFIATAPKAAAFAAFARVFVEAFAPLHIDWSTILYWICIITMVTGNLLALIQTDIKRMLAFSSIAHAGYIIMAILSGPKLADSNPGFVSNSIAFYVMVYALMNLTAFSIIYIFESREGRNLKIENFAGFGAKYPMLSVGMTIAMLSLAGIPLTGGFIAKLQIFSTAIDAGYVGLTIVAVITALISVYYYLNVLVKMYFSEPEEPLEDVEVSKATSLALMLSSAGIIVLGVLPSLMMKLM
ncbi:NADH-quinone oxidoreductase subunit N [bacterium]|nr:NADH-quinone oxidoreductase subunit N [bacterium]